MKTTLLITMGTTIVAIGGCGGAAMAPSEEAQPAATQETGAGGEQMVVQPTLEEQQTVSDYAGQMQTLATDFESSMTLSTGPDCDGAGELRDRICELSDRICNIASRHPGWSDVEEKCADATTRCENARNDVSSQCE